MNIQMLSIEILKITKGKVDKSYGGFFPSISYTQPLFEKRDALTISYNRRINRPNYRIFGDFFYMSENQIRIGNSNIKPSFPNNFQIVYNLMRKYILFGQFGYTKDDFNTNTVFQKNNNVIIQKRNWNKFYKGVIGVNINQQIFKWWNLRFNGTIVYSKLYSNFSDISMETINEIGTLSEFSIDNNFNFSGWNIEINNSYNPKGSFAYATIKDNYFTNLSVRKNFFKNKLTLSLSVKDLFDHYNDRMITELGNLKTVVPLQRTGRYIRLSLRYNFHYGKKKVRDKKIKRRYRRRNK